MPLQSLLYFLDIVTMFGSLNITHMFYALTVIRLCLYMYCVILVCGIMNENFFTEHVPYVAHTWFVEYCFVL